MQHFRRAFDVGKRRALPAVLFHADGFADNDVQAVVPVPVRLDIDGHDGDAVFHRHEHDARAEGLDRLFFGVEFAFGEDGHHAAFAEAFAHLAEGLYVEVFLVDGDAQHPAEKPVPKAGGEQVFGRHHVQPPVPYRKQHVDGVEIALMVRHRHCRAADLFVRFFVFVMPARAQRDERGQRRRQLYKVKQKIAERKELSFLSFFGFVVFGFRVHSRVQ